MAQFQATPTLAQQLSSGAVYQQLGPSMSNQERLVTQALLTASIPADEVAEIRPPLPIDPFPPRFGYPDYPERQPIISEVLDVDRYYLNRRDDISGGVQGWQSGARNTESEVW